MERNAQNPEDLRVPNCYKKIAEMRGGFSLEEEMSMIVSALSYVGNPGGSATGEDLLETPTNLQGGLDCEKLYCCSYDISARELKRSRSGKFELQTHEDGDVAVFSSTNNSAEVISCHSSPFPRMKHDEGSTDPNENKRMTLDSGN